MSSRPLAPLSGASEGSRFPPPGHRHAVALYASEEQLSAEVARFLAAGLRQGETALVVAAPARRASLARWLHRVEGVDRVGERVAFVDAEACLATFMAGDLPDPARCRAEIAALLDRLAGGGEPRRTRVYGEMVDVLWREGKRRGALMLEDVWNELARGRGVALLCAYAASAFHPEAAGGDFDAVCRAHGNLVRFARPAAAPPEVEALERRARGLAGEIGPRRQLEAALRDSLAEQLALEAELRRRTEALARALDLDEAFLGVLGHDLRNPLQAIAIGAALIEGRAGSDEIARPAARILASAHHLARLLEQLVDVARVRAGQGLELAPVETDLEPICRRAIAGLEAAGAPPRVRLLVDGACAGRWDRDRLEQAIASLLANALARGPAGRPVAVTLSGRSPDRAALEVHHEGTLAPGELRALFEPFAGVDRWTRTARQGPGLGLFLAREIARAHGGTIDALSSDGAGTRLALELPRQPPAALP